MKADTLRGHLDSLILASLEDKPLHGYKIMEVLRSRSGGSLDVPAGTVYPALRRLELSGCLEGDWEIAEGRRRRTYRLTRSGRRVLKAERADWRVFASVIEHVLQPDPQSP